MKTPISPEEFQAWRESPATQAVMKFLADYRENLKERWAAGTDLSSQMQDRAASLGALINLSHDEIEQFYQ